MLAVLLLFMPGCMGSQGPYGAGCVKGVKELLKETPKGPFSSNTWATKEA